MKLLRSASIPPRAIRAMLLLCAVLFWSLQCSAQEDNALSAPLDRTVKSCALHLLLPAKWTLKVEKAHGHCRLIAQLPETEQALCGVYDEGDDQGNGKKTFCDEAKRIVLDVQRGSIKQLESAPGIGDTSTFPQQPSDPRWGDFVYANGTWSLDATMGNYRGDDEEGRPGVRIESPVETKEIPVATRRIIYAERPWRKHFREGSYCCTAVTWEALIDLPGSRFAWIEIQWGEKEENVERFLRAVR